VLRRPRERGDGHEAEPDRSEVVDAHRDAKFRSRARGSITESTSALDFRNADAAHKADARQRGKRPGADV
jgi:hypothetical protein